MSCIEKVADKHRSPIQTPDCLPLIRSLMEARSMSRKTLAAASGIAVSRLETLIDHDPDDSAVVTVAELRNIIAALDLDPLEVIIRADTFDLIADDDRDRFDPIIRLLSAIFREVSASVLRAAVELGNIEDPEVQPEWTPLLKDVILQRIVKEIAVEAGRRQRWILDV
ncbi:hypothetical protein KRZ98_17635 [Sphingobium sp. AS12]|uniref:helix-turn-helix domain-containing protein n=1 Tax=Sphingobium sp. AS12 TaxID=2849495 RepID=UPI001C317734|nr:helix-turn-helix domain-containing protein [Sphingobium sp. AS12]MBV2150068.1 hypothetical protein [Sphingobium sp. AS12]